MKEQKPPSCFISYAWDKENTLYAKITHQIAEDLKTAGIEVWLDIWQNLLTTSIFRFTEKLNETDYVLVAGTEKYKEKWKAGRGNVLWIEVDQIGHKYKDKPESVIPALLDRAPSNSLPNFLKSVYCNFHEDHYKAFFEVLTVLLKDRVPVEEFKDEFFKKEFLIQHEYDATTLLKGLEEVINEVKRQKELLKEEIEKDFSQYSPNGKASNRKT